MLSSADSLDLFRLVVEQASDGIIFADREGVIQIWNRGAAELFGYLPQEAVGRPLDIIVPEHLRHAHWEGFGKAVASGHTRHGTGALKTRQPIRPDISCTSAWPFRSSRTGRPR